LSATPWYVEWRLTLTPIAAILPSPAKRSAQAGQATGWRGSAATHHDRYRVPAKADSP
jgi:hypothetical protein